MAKTTQLRVHLITPKESSESSRETFNDLFYSSDTRAFYPEDELDSHNVLVSNIIEDREDHRSDIRKLRSFVEEEFPDHDVFYTERNSPRNREEDPALDYSKDVVIGVCNGESTSPQIQMQVTIDGLKTGNTDPCPVLDNIYVTFTESHENEGYDLIGVDLDQGKVIWRENIQNSKNIWSNPTKCDHGILVSTGMHDLRLHDPDTGSEQWNLEMPYEPEGGMYLRNTSPVTEEDRGFIGSGDGYIYEISLENGSFESVGTFGEAVYELGYDLNSGTLVALVGPGSEKRYQSKYSWDDDDRPSMEYSLVCISADDGSILWRLEVGELRRQDAANMTVGDEKIFFAPYDDALIAIDILSGEIHWRIDRDLLDDSDDDSNKQGLKSDSSWRSRLGSQLTISSLIASQGTVFASTSQGLLRISSDDGNIRWNRENKPLLFEQDETLICKGSSALLNSIYAINKETGDTIWQFETVGRMGGISPYGANLALTTANECLLINKNAN